MSLCARVQGANGDRIEVEYEKDPQYNFSVSLPIRRGGRDWNDVMIGGDPGVVRIRQATVNAMVNLLVIDTTGIVSGMPWNVYLPGSVPVLDEEWADSYYAAREDGPQIVERVTKNEGGA